MKQRVLTAIVLIPLVLAAIFAQSPWPLSVLAVLIATLALRELRYLLREGNPYIEAIYAFSALAFLELAYFQKVDAILLGVSALLWMFAILGLARPFAKTSKPIVPGFWIVAPLLALVLLHGGFAASQPGWRFDSPLLLILLPQWAGDTAAYFAGRQFGKRLLAPSISPKKTVVGAVANLLAALVIALLCAQIVHVPLLVAGLCGITVGILGQAGDLFESSLKRRADVKDSGRLLPGHGGVLDRIDSLLFTALPVTLILTAFSK